MRLSKDIVEIFEEPKDRCKGCNNVKGCVTCVDGSEWAHYHCEEPDIPPVFDEGYYERLAEEPLGRTKSDIDAAMAEVEEKAKAFTEAHKGESVDEILAEMRGEEPVSEDLEKAEKEWLTPQLDKSYADYGETKMMELTRFDGYAMLDAIEFGAKWQKEQDQSIIELAEDHAMFAGMEKMKEQMMAKAVDATVHIEAGNYPYIPQIELYDYDNDIPLAKEGDKYKVVLIKED